MELLIYLLNISGKSILAFKKNDFSSKIDLIHVILNNLIFTYLFTIFLCNTLFVIALLFRNFFPLKQISQKNDIENKYENNLSSQKKNKICFCFPNNFFYPLRKLYLKILYIAKYNAKKTLFFSFIFIFSLFRMIYFFMMISITSASIDMDHSQHIEESLNIANIISLVFYHAASNSFYIAFMILTIILTEEYLLASSFAPYLTNKLLKKPKIIVFCFNCLIIIVQLTLTILSIFAGAVNNNDFYPLLVEIIQLFYHGSLCLVIVLLFLSLILYSKRKRIVGLSFESNDQYRTVLKTSFIVFIIIIFKSLNNFLTGFFHLVDLSTSQKFIDPILRDIVVTIYITIAALFLDITPIILLIIAWGNHDKKNSGIIINENTSLNLSYQTRKNILIHSARGGDSFDSDGTFITSN